MGPPELPRRKSPRTGGESPAIEDKWARRSSLDENPFAEQGGGSPPRKLAWPRPRSEAEIAKLLIFPRLLGDRPPAQRKNGRAGKLSMKCPIDDRVTAQQGSPAEPHQQRLYSMPTSRLATKCPIEVGVGREVNLASITVCGGFKAKSGLPELPRRSARSG